MLSNRPAASVNRPYSRFLPFVFTILVSTNVSRNSTACVLATCTSERCIHITFKHSRFVFWLCGFFFVFRHMQVCNKILTDWDVGKTVCASRVKVVFLAAVSFLVAWRKPQTNNITDKFAWKVRTQIINQNRSNSLNSACTTPLNPANFDDISIRFRQMFTLIFAQKCVVPEMKIWYLE